MTYKKLIYILFATLLPWSALTSCSDDDFVLEQVTPPQSALDPEIFEQGLTLNMAITLDNMGGSGEYNPMEDIENYIDPEKLRVMFFDSDDRFLFESKSRRVKKLGAATDHTEWLVSVPFYDSGNDVGENWDWKRIRTALTTDSFKIAILANRPLVECYPDMTKVGNAVKQFRNDGPYWTSKDTGVKRVFDLHHSQWDPIYTDKGKRADGSIEGYYEFIMGTDPTKTKYEERLLMSSTSCWVDHGANYDDQGTKWNDKRIWIRPSQNYPIPMYGIQRFAPVTNWTEGTPFNLSDITQGGNKDYDYKAISLLRSVVKLELLIPMSYPKPSYVGMKYCNIYARCEPMDVWTPTDLIWKSDHANDCEWRNITAYGAISRTGDPQGDTQTTSPSSIKDANSFQQYRERISWLYGAWLDKYKDGTPRWSFGKFGTANVGAHNTKKLPYPRVFNPLTQRNSDVVCRDASDMTSLYNTGLHYTGYYHYVVYTGERNVNDPSDLFTLGTTTSQNGGNGKAPTISWVFNLGNNPTLYYNLPIGPNCGSHSTTATNTNAIPANDVTYEYHKKVWANPFDETILPWPLVRNHVYRIVVGAKSKSGDALSFSTECRSTPDIRFY